MRLTAWCQKRALPDYRNPQKDRKGKKSSSLRKSVRFYLCAGALWKIIGDDGILPCKDEHFLKLFPSSRSGNGRTGSFGVSVQLFQLNVDLPTPTFFWSSAFPPHITKVWPTSGPCSGKDCRKTLGPLGWCKLRLLQRSNILQHWFFSMSNSRVFRNLMFFWWVPTCSPLIRVLCIPWICRNNNPGLSRLVVGILEHAAASPRDGQKP